MKRSGRGRLRSLLAAAPGMGLVVSASWMLLACEARELRVRVPTPRPSPVSRGIDPPGVDTVYWNSFVARAGSTKTIEQSPEGELRLPPGSDYVFTFDLSAYDYARSFARHTESVKAGEALVAEIQRTEVEELTAFVHPVIAGRGLKFAPGEAGTRALTVALKKLREPPAAWNGQEDFPSFAARVVSGRIELRLQAIEPGCAAIGLSIWHKDLNIPLDYLERRAVVTDASGQAPPCAGAAPSGPASSFRGSLLTLLQQSNGLPADAALHIFEMKAGTDPVRSVAVFLEKGGPAYAWMLRERLSVFTTSPDGLVRRLALSRSRQDYKPVASALETAVFDGESADDRDKAQKALLRVRALAARPSSRRGVFFARLVDVEGASLFLPLGLLPSGGTGFLGASVDLIQPLPRESYGPAAACIRPWQVVLPKDLGETVDESYFKPVDSIAFSKPIEKWKDFADYLEGSSRVASPEGIVLLAHHGGGDVWFVPNQDVLRYSQVTHPWQPGSAALLIMCGAGALTGEQPLAFVKQLNALGVDAAIVSPFAISTPFGVRVATHFASQIEHARRDKARLTLLELLRRTTDSIQKDPLVAGQKDEIFQFILAGNGSLQICFEESNR